MKKNQDKMTKLRVYCWVKDCEVSIMADEDDKRLSVMGYYTCDKHKERCGCARALEEDHMIIAPT
jgi:hypothetical protein